MIIIYFLRFSEVKIIKNLIFKSKQYFSMKKIVVKLFWQFMPIIPCGVTLAMGLMTFCFLG